MKKYNYDNLVNEFKKVIKKGDIWLIHSSLKSIGYVEGGPESVVNALKECIGEEGTLCMPTFSYSFIEKPAYDVKNSPSEVGVITEIFRISDKVVRSNHPTHSISAWGKYAENIVSDWEDFEPYSFKGSFGRLFELNSKIMLLGCGLYPNSTLHAIEDWLNMPYLCSANAHRHKENGEIEILNFKKMPLGHRDFYYDKSPLIPKYALPLIDKKVIIEEKIGEAKTYIMEMKELVYKTIENISIKKDLLLCDKENCEFCKKAKQKLLKWEVKKWL